MTLNDVLHYGFMQRALLAGVLIATVCSLLGFYLVLRRFSLIGDGLAHTTFGSVAFVLFLGISPLYVTLASLPIVMIASLAIHQLTSTRKINADAAIGLVSSLGISAGIILSSLSGGFNIDLFSYLFGNILTVTSTELYLSSMVLAVTVIFVAFFYNDLFVTTFDQELAQSMGIHTRRINIIIFLLTAVAAVLSMKVAGVMLASALLILPALTALQLSASFKKTLAAAVFFASLAVICGIFFAFLLNLPAGPSIVLFNVCFLLITYTAKKISPTRS